MGSTRSSSSCRSTCGSIRRAFPRATCSCRSPRRRPRPTEVATLGKLALAHRAAARITEALNASVLRRSMLGPSPLARRREPCISRRVRPPGRAANRPDSTTGTASSRGDGRAEHRRLPALLRPGRQRGHAHRRAPPASRSIISCSRTSTIAARSRSAPRRQRSLVTPAVVRPRHARNTAGSETMMRRAPSVRRRLDVSRPPVRADRRDGLRRRVLPLQSARAAAAGGRHRRPRTGLHGARSARARPRALTGSSDGPGDQPNAHAAADARLSPVAGAPRGRRRHAAPR